MFSKSNTVVEIQPDGGESHLSVPDPSLSFGTTVLHVSILAWEPPAEPREGCFQAGRTCDLRGHLVPVGSLLLLADEWGSERCTQWPGYVVS